MPPPNLTVGDFDARLAELGDTLRDIPGDLVMGGDINEVTFATKRVAGLIRGWRISEKLIGSD